MPVVFFFVPFIFNGQYQIFLYRAFLCLIRKKRFIAEVYLHQSKNTNNTNKANSVSFENMIISAFLLEDCIISKKMLLLGFTVNVLNLVIDSTTVLQQ